MQSEVIEINVDYACAIKKLPYPKNDTSLEWKRIHDFNELKMSLCSILIQEKFWAGNFQIHFYFRLDKRDVDLGLLRDPCTENAIFILNETFKIESPIGTASFSDDKSCTKVLKFTYIVHNKNRRFYDTISDPYYLWALGVNYKKYSIPYGI